VSSPAEEAPDSDLSSLGARLRQLRTTRFASGAQFARALSWSQSKVSRLESGKGLPTRSDLEAWTAATVPRGASAASPDDMFEELWALRERARIERSRSADRSRSPGPRPGLEHYTRKIELMAATRRVREFGNGTLPLVLHTHEFLVERLTDAATTLPTLVDDRVIERFARLRVQVQDLLYRPDRSLQVVVTESALYAGRGPTTTAQLDRIREITSAAASELDFRVLPYDVPHPVPPLTAFTLLDGGVVIPSLGAYFWLEEPEAVRTYTDVLDELARRSVGGVEADDLVRRARRHLQ
jgi:transcriptional regulator with XRE-family HTH domain